MPKRFTLLITAALFLFSSSTWAQLSTTSPWPKIHKDKENRGYTSNVGTAIGKLKWSFLTEKPITSSPVLDDNNRIYFGSADKNIYCLDRTTGGLIWKYATGDAIEHSSPAIDVNGILYIGSVDKKLYAFDTKNIDPSNPTPLWAFTTGAGIYGSPNIADDGTIYFGSADGNLYQIAPNAQAPWPANNLSSDPTKYLWKQYVGIIWSTPTIDTVLDDRPPNNPPNNPPLVIPSVIIGSTKYGAEDGTDIDTAGSCGFKFNTTLKAFNVYIYNLEDKSIRDINNILINTIPIWYGPKKSPAISGVYGSIVLQPDHAVLIPFETDGLLSGPLCWLPVNNPDPIPIPPCIYVPADADKWCLSQYASGYIKGTPAVIPEGSYYLGHGSTLSRFHPGGGEYFSYLTAGTIEASAAVDGNLNTYIGCNGGVFYCFNSNSPDQPLRWRYPETGVLQKLNGDAAEIISSPAIDGSINDPKHSVYFGASDGKMYAFYDGAAITGKVSTVDGLGLAAVTITLKDSNDKTIAVTSTDTSGLFKFPAIATGQYTVLANKDGFIFVPTVAPVTLTNDQDAYVAFIAQKSFTLIGKVVNGETGAGLPNVSVGLITKNDLGVIVYTDTSTTTDTDGNYTFTNIGYGTSVITPSLAGWGFDPQSASQSIPTGTVHDEPYTIPVITGTVGYQISGTVKDATKPDDPNNGLSDITITLSGALASGASFTTQQKTTGSDGTFSFTGLSNGTYTVTPSAAGYKFDFDSKVAVIKDASVPDLVFLAAQGIKITGLIKQSDTTASFDGFTVNLYLNDVTFWSKIFNPNKARTLVATANVSATGAFIFMGVAAGSYILEPVATGYGFDPANITISALSDLSGIVFNAVTGFSISGGLYSLLGTPQPGIDVSLAGSGGTAPSVTTDSKGLYTFTGLQAGTYTVSPDQTGIYTTVPTSKIVTISDANVNSVNFITISFCSKTFITIPPWGETGAEVSIIGLNFGPTPDPAGTTSVTVTLSNGQTATVAPGVYFGTTDPATWVKATVSNWTPFYITAKVPQLTSRLVRVWVVRSSTDPCISIITTNYFVNTNQ